MEKKIQMIFTGDVMTHGYQITAAKDKQGGYDFHEYFSDIKEYIDKADIAVCNLETTLSDGDYSGFPRFKSPDQLAEAIAAAGFKVAAAANNHCYDNKLEGIVRTRRVLEDNGLTVIGTRKTPEEKAYTIIPVQGVNVAILNFTYESAKVDGKTTLNSRQLDSVSTQLVNSFSNEDLEDDLKQVWAEMDSARAEGAQIVVVFYHWGTEYECYSNAMQKYIAWKTAKMGADAIIGSHPHVLQERETLHVTVDGRQKDVPVFYSLGNYIWGGTPKRGRETVLNSILAVLNISYDPDRENPVEVGTDYVPLYISQRSQTGKRAYSVVDISKNTDAYAKQLAEIADTVEDRIRPMPTVLRFEKIVEVGTGNKRALIPFYLPEGDYTAFGSVGAITASALQNGEIVGNSPGYAGISAETAGGQCVCLLAHVTGEDNSTLPVAVNYHNRLWGNYIPKDMVFGDEYFLPDEVSKLLPEAANAWVEMRTAALADGIVLSAASGFRSKKSQLMRANKYAERWGEEKTVKRYMPIGASEHHLGLALDIIGGSENGVDTSKEDAIIWVGENAHRFGFLARQGKSIQHMAYIHVRYVGSKSMAEYIHRMGFDLEAYLQDCDQ